MFEDQTNEPEDIFAGADAQPTPGSVMTPSAPNQSAKPVAPLLDADDGVVSSGPNKTFVILIVVILLLLVLVGGALVYTWMTRATGSTSSSTNTLSSGAISDTTATVPTSPTSANPLPTVPQATTPTPQPETPADTDKDGLTDAEEAVLGTNPTLVDTDNDGLSDADEVKVWKTDPLNPDTDGDGYKDGDEVKAGYDPKIAGAKLLNLPASDAAPASPQPTPSDSTAVSS